MSLLSLPPHIKPSDFDEVKIWRFLPENQQAYTRAYRQPKWRVGSSDIYGYHDAFHRLMYQKDATSGRLRYEYELPRLVFECLERTEHLKALADNRNLGLPGPSDWYRITDVSQARMKEYIIRLLRFTQQTGQYNIPGGQQLLQGNRQRWLDLVDDFGLCTTVAVCHRVERLELDQRLRLQRGQGGVRNSVSWITAFSRSLNEAYESMIAAWRWSEAHGRHVLPTFIMALRDMPEMTRLIMVLLERETSFDTLLSQEHLFGCQYDKVISLFNPLRLTMLWNEVYVTATRDDQMKRDLGIYQHLNPLYRELQDCQTRLDKLFDYRVTMKLNWHRMWDCLYVLIDPRMRISDETMNKFTRTHMHDFSTERLLFGIAPVTTDQMQGEQCPICLTHFVDGDHSTDIGVVILKTKCGHYFHPKCIFQHWDRPNYWQNQCPVCRQPAGRLQDLLAPDTRIERPTFEWELPGQSALAELYRDQVVNQVGQRLRIPYEWTDPILKAYWGDWVLENILKPMREEREADRPSWGSVLGE